MATPPQAGRLPLLGQSSASSEEAAEAKPIQITYGYSRDKRPDLKQFIAFLNET